MTTLQWFMWFTLLVAQNISFTFVSRARNSASLTRHMVASLFSNGLYFIGQIIILTQVIDMLRGDYGTHYQVVACSVYTVATLTGSMLGHKVAMITEKGKTAVGASKHYAQITTEEWEKVKCLLVK